MTGIELCRNIRQQHPELPFFLVTGRQLEIAGTGIVEELNVTDTFAKPFSPGTVVAAVEAAIAKHCESEAAVS